MNLYIVTPCKNAAPTLDRTIESVLSQSDIGMVHYHIQDGASTDETSPKLARWQDRLQGHPWCRFSYASAPDTGMYDGIAKGFNILDVCEPDAFMGWINADDCLLPEALETVAVVHQQHPSLAWLGGLGHVTRMSGQGSSSQNVPYFPQALLAEGLCDGMHWSLLQQEGVFWKKSLWDKVGGINTQCRLAADWDLWRRMAYYTPYCAVDRPLGSFSRREGQLSGDYCAYEHEIASILSHATRNRSALHALFWASHSDDTWQMPVLHAQDGQWLLTKHQGLSPKRWMMLLLSGLGLGRAVQIYRIWKREHVATV